MRKIRSWFRHRERFFARLYLFVILLIAGLSVMGIAYPSNPVGGWINTTVMKFQDWRENNWSKRLDLAEQSIQQGDTSQAIEMLRSLINDIPSGASGIRGNTRRVAKMTLGELLSQQSMSEEAIEIFEGLMARYSGMSGLHKRYARVLLAAGHSEEAISEWQECLRLDPTDYEAVTEYTQCLTEANRKAEASEVIERYWNAFEVAKVNYGDHSNLGLKLWNTNEEVGRWNLRPLVDQQEHIYRIPVDRTLNSATDKQIDRVSLSFQFGPFTQQLQVYSIALLGAKNDFTLNRPEQIVITDFQDARLSGLTLDQDSEQAFLLSESSNGRVSLEVLLPNSISTKQVDLIEVRMRVSKREIPGWSAGVSSIRSGATTESSDASGEE